MATRELSSVEINSDPNDPNLNKDPLQVNDKPLEEKLQVFVSMVYSNDRSNQLLGTQEIRKLISGTILQKVIDTGVVPKIVEFMGSSNLKLQFESAWVILNICSDTSEHVKYIISLGALPIIMNLLDSDDCGVADKAAWIIGNIARDSLQHRDLCLQLQAMERLVKTLLKFPENISLCPKYYIDYDKPCKRRPNTRMESCVCEFVSIYELSIGHRQTMPGRLLMGYFFSQQYQQFVWNLKKYLQEMTNYPSTTIAALKSLASISKGDEAQVNMLLSHPDFLPNIFTLMTHQEKSIREEVCLIASNIAAGTKQQLDLIFNTPHYMEALIKIVLGDDAKVVHEASWCLCNLTKGGSQ